MAEPALSRLRRARVAAWRWAPAFFVVAFALAMIWPAPIGKMPMSQDHTVHLARAWMFGELVKTGHVFGWSSYWYFGFPLGELYPVSGDILCSLLRGLSFGFLPWTGCYALAFSIAYASQGLAVLRTSRALGLGAGPGVIAAALIYLDPGVLREGGWSYTVHYGVWLQPVACALVWCAFAELAMVLQRGSADWPMRKLVVPALLLGIALLSHPIAMPMIAAASVVFVVVLGYRAAAGRVLLATGSVVAVGSALSAWWVLPLMSNRHWMANFGTLFSDIGTMLSRVLGGSWAKHMSPTIGWTITIGLVWCLVRGNRFAKFTALFAVMLWSMSTSDLFFSLRLDWLSESFRYLQYQRFIICAKPGLYLACGAVIVATTRWALGRFSAGARDHRAWLRLALGLLLATTALGLVGVGAAKEAQKAKLGRIRVDRVSGDKKFETHWRNAGEWASKQWEQREEFFRFAYKARRHSHVYADAPVWSHAPAYKLGFTPGEVFLHKLESEQAAVLDRLRVRYLIGTNTGRGKVLKRFGKIKVVEREMTEQVVRLSGEGSFEVIQDDPDRDGVIVEVSGSSPGDRLEFNIAGYPRWELLHDGVPVEWYEVPVVGKGAVATQAERRAGDFRAGKGQAPSPNEPMLLAIDAEDGVYELRYRRWMPADVLGTLASAIAALLCIAAWVWRDRGAALLGRFEAKLRPRVVVVLGLAFALAVLGRYASGFFSEFNNASGWLRVFRAREVTGMHNGPIKIERLIGPAVLVEAAAKEPATMVLPNVDASDTIEGWAAVDDGDMRNAKGEITLTVEGRPVGGTDDDWVQLSKHVVRARSGRQAFEVETTALDAERADLRVTVGVKRGKSPRMGFDLDLR
ncbi:MAG: hypothetical protein IAG13_34670 [Deltaproteobacteria bacterium]|nr:hypothetical protein [Nannocystaceae bacterium]